MKASGHLLIQLRDGYFLLENVIQGFNPEEQFITQSLINFTSSRYEKNPLI